ncbi:MAG: hypothetical protein IJ293_03410 [Treponema sp.]|nr:hypothetical protein [Treponema sp.]
MKKLISLLGLLMLILTSTMVVSCKNDANGSDPQQPGTDDSVITVKLLNSQVLDKGSVEKLTENADGSVTYTTSAQYSGGGYVFYIREDKSVINLENYESISIDFDYEAVDGKWASEASNPKWCLNLYPEGAGFWNGATTLGYFDSTSTKGSMTHTYSVKDSDKGDYSAICLKLNAYQTGNADTDECKVTIKSIKLKRKANAGEDKPEDDGLTDKQRGQVVSIKYSSKDYENGGTATTQKPAYVYLPAGYDADDTTKKYPILYLMHGVGGNEGEWGMTGNSSRIKKYMDQQIAAGEVEPFIIVTPNGRSNSNFTNGDFSNMNAFYSFGSELRNDLIPYMEANFNISNDRNDRAMAGLSMGGMQTINIGLCESLDLISWFGAFSAAPTSNEAATTKSILEEKFADYDVNYFYNICGTEDTTALDSATKAVKDLDKICDKFVDGENFAWITQAGSHGFDIWYPGFEAFAKIIFKK